jgi:hypothetical protein
MTAQLRFSDELLGDRHALRQRLRTDTYLAFRRLIEAERVAEVRRGVAAAFAGHGFVAGSRPDDLVADAGFRDGSPGWWRFCRELQSLEAFHALAHEPTLTSVVRTILGPKVLHHPRRPLSTIPPAYHIPAHQEIQQVQGAADVLAAWIPLTTFGAGSARLEVLQDPGPVAVRPLRPLPGGGVEAATPAGHWASAELEPGDVVVLHSMATRRVTENVGDRLALAGLYRSQLARHPVCTASLKPFHYPRLPDWDGLTTGWSSRRWIRIPWRLRVVDFHLPGSIEDWHEAFPTLDSELIDIAVAPAIAAVADEPEPTELRT